LSHGSNVQPPILREKGRAIALANGKLPDLKVTMSDDGAGQYPGLWPGPVLITKKNICDLINNISPPGYITVKRSILTTQLMSQVVRQFGRPNQWQGLARIGEAE
jgi:hypothetical protein